MSLLNVQAVSIKLGRTDNFVYIYKKYMANFLGFLFIMSSNF